MPSVFTSSTESQWYIYSTCFTIFPSTESIWVPADEIMIIMWCIRRYNLKKTKNRNSTDIASYLGWYCFFCAECFISINYTTQGTRFGLKSESDWPEIWVKMYWNLIWNRPEFFPFDVNLNQFGPKSDMPTLLRHVITVLKRHNISQHLHLISSPRCFYQLWVFWQQTWQSGYFPTTNDQGFGRRAGVISECAVQ